MMYVSVFVNNVLFIMHMFELKMVCSHFCSVQLYGSFGNEVITYQGVRRMYMKRHNPKRSVYVYLHPTITQPESHVFVMLH